MTCRRRPLRSGELTPDDPHVSLRRPAAGLSITWLGHATVLLELDGTRLLTDPVLRDRIGHLIRIAARQGLDLPGGVDAVLLSHLHADHTDLPTLRRIARRTPTIAPYPAGEWLARHGLETVRELRAGAELRVGRVRVRATPAIHPAHRWPFGPAADPVGYLLRGSRSAYFAGDTDLFPAMGELRGSVDAALLPVWGWGPRLGPGHLDPERAARAVALIEPAVAIPIHWGTFSVQRPGRLGRRAADPASPAWEFAALTGRYAPGVDVRVLAPGERTEL